MRTCVGVDGSAHVDVVDDAYVWSSTETDHSHHRMSQYRPHRLTLSWVTMVSRFPLGNVRGCVQRSLGHFPSSCLQLSGLPGVTLPVVVLFGLIYS